MTILAGAGCEGAHDELIALAERLQAPVVHALRGKEFVEYDNPYDVGMTGLLGFASGYRAMEHCDALLMLGTDFPYRPFYPDAAPDRPGRRARRATSAGGCRSTSRWSARVKDTVDALLPLLRDGRDDGAPGADARRTTGGPAHGWTRSPSAGRDRGAAAPAVRRRRGRPAGRRRRRVHPRRRHADALGRPLPADERPAPADRLVHPRVDGQRAAAGHRRPGRPPGPAGRRAVAATAASPCCWASSSRSASSGSR